MYRHDLSTVARPITISQFNNDEEGGERHTLADHIGIETCEGIIRSVRIGRVDQPQVQDIAFALVDICNELFALGELTKAAPCFGSILAGLGHELDETGSRQRCFRGQCGLCNGSRAGGGLGRRRGRGTNLRRASLA